MSDLERRAFVSGRSELSGEQSDGGLALVEAIAFQVVGPPIRLRNG